MKAKYIGYAGEEADESPRYVTHLGVTFRRDRWATLPPVVDDDKLKQNPHAISAAQLEKLKGHPHFEVAEGEGDEAFEAEEPAAAAAGEGSGKAPTGSKDEIIARLTAIANEHPEFEFNPKLGAPKLAKILEDAEFKYGDND